MFLVVLRRPVVEVCHPQLILLYLTLLVVQILDEGIGNMGMGNDLLDLGEMCDRDKWRTLVSPVMKLRVP